MSQVFVSRGAPALSLRRAAKRAPALARIATRFSWISVMVVCWIDPIDRTFSSTACIQGAMLIVCAAVLTVCYRDARDRTVLATPLR